MPLDKSETLPTVIFWAVREHRLFCRARPTLGTILKSRSPEWNFVRLSRDSIIQLARTDRTGLLSMREIFVTDDLRSYAYTAYYKVSSLFVSDSTQQ